MSCIITVPKLVLNTKNDEESTHNCNPLCFLQHCFLLVLLLKVAGAPIFTYTHEPDDNEFITDARQCFTTCGARYVNIQ